MRDPPQGECDESRQILKRLFGGDRGARFRCSVLFGYSYVRGARRQVNQGEEEHRAAPLRRDALLMTLLPLYGGSVELRTS